MCAADDAAAVAWLHPLPLLVFPELFEEMARAAVVRGLRQADIAQRSKVLLAEVGLDSAYSDSQDRDRLEKVLRRKRDLNPLGMTGCRSVSQMVAKG